MLLDIQKVPFKILSVSLVEFVYWSLFRHSVYNYQDLKRISEILLILSTPLTSWAMRGISINPIL